MRPKRIVTCLSIFAICVVSYAYIYYWALVEPLETTMVAAKLRFSVDVSKSKVAFLWGRNSSDTPPWRLSIPIAFNNQSDPLWTLEKANILKDVHLLRQHIHAVNGALRIQNEDKYGTGAPEFIIVVQVHNRATHLFYLIDSLHRVHGIERGLLVFSHDLVSPEMNRLIASIGFTRVLQIFFPYSRQLYPDTFPGTDPRDCPRDGARPNCLNAEWKDGAKHYRETRFTQVKHHWTWKLFFTTEKAIRWKDFNGPVIFLEEDNFALEDMLHVVTLTTMSHPDVDLIALGSYAGKQNYANPTTVTETAWRSQKNNLGMVFTKNTLKKLQPSWKTFCLYDDYNWDWSLQDMLRQISPALKVFHFMEGGRVYHTGTCDGLHSKGSNCHTTVDAEVAQIRARIATNQLFPEAIKVVKPSSSASQLAEKARANGGWSDPRDMALCLSFSQATWFRMEQLPNRGARRVDIFEPLIAGWSDQDKPVL